MYPVRFIIFHALRSMCPESPARRKAVPPHIPHSTMERLVRQRSRAVSAPFRNTLCHNGLRNGLFGLAKEAFPHHERASSAVSKRLFRKPEKPVSQTVVAQAVTQARKNRCHEASGHTT